ncbi:YbgC/FadM family acyl-CoA thioesterase [Ottowia sp.]|uniref:YbgC/FadM family acyl-CoA thioesterase n=1 Tax=Ottowia sp. TaxID=1898956 RepID=UPI0039E3885E
MKPTDFRLHHRLRVRWAEVDVQHIVFNAHYLAYFDCAMTDYWRALALPYAETMQQLGGDTFLRKTTVEFNAPARMREQLDVALRAGRIGTSSMTYVGAIFRDHQLLATAELVYVFADPVTQTSRPVPAPLRAVIESFEAGQPVTRVQTGTWAELAEPARAVRTAVFVQEQGIPQEDEWDALDDTAVHAVVTNLLGRPVGTGRLLREAEGTARIGRMAVDRALRGGGVGRQVVQALEQAARARGDTAVVLGAQRSAEPFYARLGYAPYGEPYEEVGIPHIGMRRALI